MVAILEATLFMSNLVGDVLSVTVQAYKDFAPMDFCMVLQAYFSSLYLTIKVLV